MTCDRLGITDWQVCPFWPRMANISLVQPLGLVRQLELLIRGHLFQISTIVLKLNAPGAYPLLLGDHDSKLLASNKIGRKMSLLFRGKTKV